MTGMTRNEVIDLLTMVVAYDNRNVADATITAWHDTATNARWTFDEAAAAVRHHYTEHTEWLMPGHITAIVRSRRRSALELAPVPRHAPDPELMRRVEAIADAKAMDAPRPASSAPRQLMPGHRCAVTPGQVTIEAAMRRGEQARRGHAEADESS